MPDALSLRLAPEAADAAGEPRLSLDAQDGFSVADLCRRWRIGSDKVHAFRGSDELVGVNLAANLFIRPLWRFTREAVHQFERRRSSVPAPKPARRRLLATSVDFFPD